MASSLVIRFEALPLLRVADREFRCAVRSLPTLARSDARFEPQRGCSSDRTSATNHERPGHRQSGVWLVLGMGHRVGGRGDPWFHCVAADSPGAASPKGQGNGPCGHQPRMARDCRTRSLALSRPASVERPGANSGSARTTSSPQSILALFCRSIRRTSRKSAGGRFVRVFSRGDLPARSIRQKLAHQLSVKRMPGFARFNSAK